MAISAVASFRLFPSIGRGLGVSGLASRLCMGATSGQRFFASVPEGFKYAESHEWVKPGSDGIGVVGISDFAQAALGDIVYVDLPEVGKTVSKGESFATVESVKAASDVYAPVSGEVLEINSAITAEPAKINGSPYEEAWFAKIKLSDPSELDSLLDSAAYTEHTKEA